MKIIILGASMEWLKKHQNGQVELVQQLVEAVNHWNMALEYQELKRKWEERKIKSPAQIDTN